VTSYLRLIVTITLSCPGFRDIDKNSSSIEVLATSGGHTVTLTGGGSSREHGRSDSRTDGPTESSFASFSGAPSQKFSNFLETPFVRKFFTHNT